MAQPWRVGSRLARNRIVFGPHETNLADGRAFSSRHLAYYRRRATGGTGVIVLEEASVNDSDWPYERAPLASLAAPGWADLATNLHAEGALVVAALGHAGGQGSSAYHQRPLLAPSRVPEVNTREVPKAMEAEDIDAVVGAFGNAAADATAAGCDGVEVNAGQFSLIRQFLSGLTNQRGDAYGEDRLLFARRVLAAVRAGAGDDALVGLRLSCDEMAPWAGIVPEAAADIACQLTEAGGVDYMTVVRGSIYTTWATRPDAHVPPGFNLELARQIRAALPGEVAVVAQGSIVDPAQGEEALSEGWCDAVEMTRAQIADPDLANKLAAGQPEQVRLCLLCNQACQVRDPRNPPVSCVVEPSSGHEHEDPPMEGQAGRPTDVLVVGGGPAGLECARVAAARGHRVRLVERAGHLGGMVATAAAGAGRARLVKAVEWLEAECRRLGVAIEMKREATAAELADTKDAVVICTGSRTGERSYTTDAGARVLTAAEVLAAVDGEDGGLPPGPVVVWDPIGGPVAVSVAESLAATHEVTLVTPDFLVGNQLSATGDLVPANTRLHGAGVHLVRRAVVRRVDAEAVEVEDRFNGKRQGLPAGALVDCGHRLPDDALWRETGGRFARAGDCVAPRSLYQAILEGRRAALTLEASP